MLERAGRRFRVLCGSRERKTASVHPVSSPPVRRLGKCLDLVFSDTNKHLVDLMIARKQHCGLSVSESEHRNAESQPSSFKGWRQAPRDGERETGGGCGWCSSSEDHRSGIVRSRHIDYVTEQGQKTVASIVLRVGE